MQTLLLLHVVLVGGRHRLMLNRLDLGGYFPCEKVGYTHLLNKWCESQILDSFRVSWIKCHYLKIVSFDSTQFSSLFCTINIIYMELL